MKKKEYTLHVLSHTHWDREWYQDFQGFRQRLVYQIDKLMELLEQRPDYRYFHLDGQTIWLKDYLRIRPESAQRLAGHVRSGRILIGPWFVMPDELLLSGESLVRNLNLGCGICREFGVEPMPVGYVTDVFGHCSQLPQIVRGLGFDTVVLHRGTSNADDASEMLWKGADGSKVLVIKAHPGTGYQDFLTYRDSPDSELIEYEKKKKAFAKTRVLFGLDGNDHTPALWNTPEKIDQINAVLQDTVCVHSSLPAYLSGLKHELGDYHNDGLKTYTGELRYTKKAGLYADLMTGTASSRLPLKQMNDHLEYLLARCAEPLHLWSVWLGGDSQKPFLDLAWEYLITNHPHDSICGCSIDQVHRDMVYRFDQARLLAQNSIGESIQAVFDRLDTTSLGESEAVVTVYNPANVPSGPLTRLYFEILSSDVQRYAKQGLHPVLIDGGGAPVYYETERIDYDAWPSPSVKKVRGESPAYLRKPNGYSPHHRFHVNAAASVPAMGYSSFAIRFLPKDVACPTALPDGMRPVVVDKAGRTIENEYLRLAVREDALIDLYDKRTGVWYRGLHDFEDCGDAGDGWNHVYPESDVRVIGSTPGARSGIRIRFEKTGLLSATAVVSFNLRVPRDLSASRKTRLRATTALPMEMRLTLRRGCARVDVETAIRNSASCHRLRALFPTGRDSRVWLGDSAFDVVERNIELPDTTGWVEQAREETPIKNFAAVHDEVGGLAILTKGLCEACVRDVPERALALTLFRSFRQQIGDGWTLDSLLLGDINVNYSLWPFAAEGFFHGIQREIERFKMPVFSLTSPSHGGDLSSSSGEFMSVPEELVVSTIKMSEDGESTIVRLFNPGTTSAGGRLRLQFAARKAWRCDLLERNEESLPVDPSGSVHITLKPKEVATLRLQ